jgi:hypothetical protein
MVSLVDIVPQTRVVQLAAGELELRGLGLRQIADLFLSFPSLRNVFTPGAPEISAAEIIIGAPDAIGTIVAAAAGQPEAADRLVDVGSGLAPDEIFDCLDVIWNLTFPRGITPFLTKAMPFVAVFLRSDDDDLTGKDLDTNALPQPNGSLPQGIPLEQ